MRLLLSYLQGCSEATLDLYAAWHVALFERANHGLDCQCCTDIDSRCLAGLSLADAERRAWEAFNAARQVEREQAAAGGAP